MIDRLVQARLLDDAAKILEECGWTQGWMYKPSGEMCLMGAVCEAIESYEEKGSLLGARIFLSLDSDELIFMGDADNEKNMESTIIEWNDDDDRTKEEVIERLVKSAEKLRGQHEQDV